MDFEKNFLEIENEDDIFNLDEENRNEQGQETFCAEEEFKALELNVSSEENEVIDSKAKNKKIINNNNNINSSHLSSSFFGVVASMFSTILIIGTATGFLPTMIKDINVSNFISRSTELGFIVEKDSNKEYVMSLYNDNYNDSKELTTINEYIYTDLNPNTVYNLDIYEISDDTRKKVYSANYLTKANDEYNAEIFNSEILDKKLRFNVQYEGSNLDFVTVLVFENGKQVFLYEGKPKDEFDVSLGSEFSEVTCKVYINGEMTEFKQFIESDVVPAEDEDEPTDDETTGDDTEKISVESVSLSESEITLVIDETKAITATVMPYNAVDKSVTWESSDTDVATVANGVITAVGVGETTIKVTTVDGGFTATCIVTVVDNSIHVTGVSFENDTESVEQNKTITLVPIIAPTNATNTNVSWESSDTDVATVNSNGLVTGVMPGEATITVTTEDGNFTATCVITVTAIEPTFSNFFIESNKTNSGNEIITFSLGYEDPSLVWKNKFIVECLRKTDSEVLFKDYVIPSSSKYAALNRKNRYMLLEWNDSYLEALSNPEVITYTINVYAESDPETVIYTDDIYSGNCFTTGMNQIPGSIILDGNVNVSGQVKPQFHISGLSGIDNIEVIFSYPATGEAVFTIQDVTLDEIITADINLPSGSTPYNVTVNGYIDSEYVTVISEKITISNN